MPERDSDTERFSLLVAALRPWLGTVIFITQKLLIHSRREREEYDRRRKAQRPAMGDQPRCAPAASCRRAGRRQCRPVERCSQLHRRSSARALSCVGRVAPRPVRMLDVRRRAAYEQERSRCCTPWPSFC